MSPRAATFCHGLPEQRVEVTDLDGVAALPSSERPVPLHRLQQRLVVGERGVDAVPDASGYHDNRDVAGAVYGPPPVIG